MTLVMETFNSASVGLSRLHFAKQTNKGSASLYPTYEPLVRIDGIVSGTVTPQGGVESDFADNKVHAKVPLITLRLILRLKLQVWVQRGMSM